MSDVLECCKINQTVVKKKTMIPLKMVKMIVEVKKKCLKKQSMSVKMFNFGDAKNNRSHNETLLNRRPRVCYYP